MPYDDLGVGWNWRSLLGVEGITSSSEVKNSGSTILSYVPDADPDCVYASGGLGGKPRRTGSSAISCRCLMLLSLQTTTNNYICLIKKTFAGTKRQIVCTPNSQVSFLTLTSAFLKLLPIILGFRI